MKRTTSTSARHLPSTQLQPLAQRLAGWRAQRGRGQRIPEELWKAAAELARTHGLNRTAAALKLNYYGLQRRLQGGRAWSIGSTGPAPARFVELPPLAGSSPATVPGTVELLRPSGARLILRLPTANPRQLLPLVQAFLRS